MKSRWLAVAVIGAVLVWTWPAMPDEPSETAKSSPRSMLGTKSGEVRDDNDLKMELIWCQPGFITMEQVERVEVPIEEDGEMRDDDPDEKPNRKMRTIEKIVSVKVYLTRGYWLGKFEVTRSQWEQVMPSAPWRRFRPLRAGGPDFPAADITWFEAMDFCKALTERERKAGRLPSNWEYTLPTEAQWERAWGDKREIKGVRNRFFRRQP